MVVAKIGSPEDINVACENTHLNTEAFKTIVHDNFLTIVHCFAREWDKTAATSTAISSSQHDTTISPVNNTTTVPPQRHTMIVQQRHCVPSPSADQPPSLLD